MDNILIYMHWSYGKAKFKKSHQQPFYSWTIYPLESRGSSSTGV
jgi:spore cortex formation protein SpoVR/YcgB (stage V sporulation)